MEPDRWQQIQDVYLDALEQPPEARTAFLERVAGADSELRAEVQSLLAADTAGDPVLDATFDDLLDLLDEEAPGEPVPERAGPYRVLEEIGRGGMGTVYRAERDDGQYTREVALKLVLAAGSRADIVRRFGRERQILAGLEHPHIARLYDAGVTEAGLPFLAMELVRGEPIHTYCDRLRLSIPARLRLFEQVVAAVEYAHRKLVIHRDLKPSNVLVTDEQEVKLLDFGIAKLMESEESTADDPLTRLDQRLLTPEYAAPEQLRGEALSTAADVYALGVMLHHLLVGTRPSGSGLPTPSTAATTVEVAGLRDSDPPRLRRQLKGDLDTIVLKALRPEAEQRYPTAAALLEDLTRFRTGQPITARAPSFAYRARKFVGRNRIAVVAGTAAVMGLVGGLGVALHQAQVARAERDLAESVSGFLVNLFNAANPFQRSSERLDTLRIQAFLDRAVDRLDTDLADQPELKARMQNVLGAVHEGLGLYDPALALMNASVAGYRVTKGEQSPEVTKALGDLARVLQMSGDAAAAEETYRLAIPRMVALHGERSAEVAQLRVQLAAALVTQDRLPEAETMLQAAIEVRRHVLEDSLKIADDLNLLGALQYRQGKVDRAAETMRQSLEMNRAALGPDHPNVAVISQNLALILNRAERYDEAEPLLREAIEAMRRALGPDYPEIGGTIKTLASVLEAKGRAVEADSLYREAIDHSRRGRGAADPSLAIALHDYGAFRMKLGDLAGADSLIVEARDLELSANGPDHPGTAVTTGTLADLRRRQGDALRAEALYRESLRSLEAIFPPTHPRVLNARRGLALSLADQRRTSEAEPLLLDVYEAAKSLEDGGVETRATARSLALFYEGLGNQTEAARWQALSEAPPG
ncbi:MAG: serine/threonine-protein kinase [Gemmatimonadota bacterium]